VQFLADGTALGSPVTLAGGVASVTTASLSHGTHAITAQYPGDGNFQGSTNSLNPNELIDSQPVAASLNLERYASCGVKVSVASVLASAADQDNDALALVSAGPASAGGGTIAMANGWVFYTPPAGITNSDIFSYVISNSFGLQSTGAVSVDIVVDTNISENTVAVTATGRNSTLIQFQGVANRAYTVDYATNLISPNWQPIGTGAADGTGSFQFTDTPPTGTPPRSYRSTYP